MKRLIIIVVLSLFFINTDLMAQKNKKYEWDKFPIPVEIDNNKEWVLDDEISDDFNYKAKAGNLGKQFFSKWKDNYQHKWTGPAPTYWKSEYISTENGCLRIDAARPDDAPTKMVESDGKKMEMPVTYTGCITSLKTINYPVYVEAYAKVANSTLASDVWMLSDDSTQEIDIIEAYGSSRGGDYFAERMHLSHHVFIRKPFQDYQPTDKGTWYVDTPKTFWRDSFRRVGVYWRDPYHLEYYVDGKLVRTTTGKEMIDPKDFTDGTGLVKDMRLIINREDQSWRAIQGLSPTSEELKDREAGKYLVDWVRVYQLVDKK